jgi:hypothetical protein
MSLKQKSIRKGFIPTPLKPFTKQLSVKTPYTSNSVPGNVGLPTGKAMIETTHKNAEKSLYAFDQYFKEKLKKPNVKNILQDFVVKNGIGQDFIPNENKKKAMLELLNKKGIDFITDGRCEKLYNLIRSSKVDRPQITSLLLECLNRKDTIPVSEQREMYAYSTNGLRKVLGRVTEFDENTVYFETVKQAEQRGYSSIPLNPDSEESKRLFEVISQDKNFQVGSSIKNDNGRNVKLTNPVFGNFSKNVYGKCQLCGNDINLYYFEIFDATVGDKSDGFVCARNFSGLDIDHTLPPGEGNCCSLDSSCERTMFALNKYKGDTLLSIGLTPTHAKCNQRKSNKKFIILEKGKYVPYKKDILSWLGEMKETFSSGRQDTLLNIEDCFHGTKDKFMEETEQFIFDEMSRICLTLNANHKSQNLLIYLRMLFRMSVFAVEKIHKPEKWIKYGGKEMYMKGGSYCSENISQINSREIDGLVEDILDTRSNFNIDESDDLIEEDEKFGNIRPIKKNIPRQRNFRSSLKTQQIKKAKESKKREQETKEKRAFQTRTSRKIGKTQNDLKMEDVEENNYGGSYKKISARKTRKLKPHTSK